MASQFEKFRNALNKMFMLDQADLDFGIYRIMNQKRDEITRYLTVTLPKQVKDLLAENTSTHTVELQKQLEETIQQVQSLGYDPDSNPKVIALREEIGKAGSSDEMENTVYSHLTAFFSRYYDGGDFISQRRYKKDVYAIPYEGEEVKLHWANADQYYIKTGEYFRNYSFTIADNKRVEFTLKDVTTEQNNNLAQNNMERRFALYEEEPITVDGDTLHINFSYELYPKTTKQKVLIEKAFSSIKEIIPMEFRDVFSLRPTDSDRNRTLLQKHMNDYVARNTFDYFIHKDLHGFLTRELDFYIKNEILVIDDINTRSTDEFVAHITVIKTVKAVGASLIQFLAQLENFQKRLWLKKKFVVQADYCITLDRVPEELYSEICANGRQREEWVRLFAIDEITGDGMFTTAYSEPLTEKFLQENPFLVLDTAFFSDKFKQRLISSIDNLDEQCNGLIINSENFQALQVLQDKYKKQIKCIYIDPPYNAKSSEILYKNTFKHASWLSLMENRLVLGAMLLNNDGVHITAIDEVESNKLGLLLGQTMPYFDGSAIISVIINPSGQQGKNISTNGEYLYFQYYDRPNMLAKEQRSEDNADVRNFMNGAVGEGGNYLRETGKNCFYPIIVKNNKVIGFGDVCDDEFHPQSRNVVNDDSTWIYPIDNSGVERKWLFERGTVNDIIDELSVKQRRDGELEIIRTKTKINYKTIWTDLRYNAKEHGTNLLTKLFGAGKCPFSFPKSIHAVSDSISAGTNEQRHSVVLDFFAGSGTTGHAVINLNRADNGHRKYILIEMGTYFDTVTKPRIQKVIYSEDWNNGKPVSRKGSSHCFKYMRLEQYEDTLNNLVVKNNAFGGEGEFYDGYLLGYMLDMETRDSLFNLKWFENPFDMKLRITRNNEMTEEKVDLVETFNYLIGLYVDQVAYPKDGICTVVGRTRKGKKTLVIWRDCTKVSNDALNDFFRRSAYSVRDNEFDIIYVNGDNNLDNLRTDEDTWKVVLIEQEFNKQMFNI